MTTLLMASEETEAQNPVDLIDNIIDKNDW